MKTNDLEARIKELETALEYIRRSHLDQEGHMKGKYRKTVDVCNQVLDSPKCELF